MTVYLQDGDRAPDFIIKGDSAFTIKDAHSGATVAKLWKGSAIPCM
jgi:hypothetical protein